MADKILRWYMDGKVSRTKTEVGGSHYLDANYAPEWVNIKVRIAGNGSQPLRLDINDDGTSIFTDRPALTEFQTEHRWTTLPGAVMREGSIVTLDIDEVFNEADCRDLTVELGLRKA